MANVFGALNRFIARLDSDPTSIPQVSAPSSNAYGFQVLANPNESLPLEPWFDYIIGINGRTIDSADGGLLATELRNCAGATISLGVYGAKGRSIREIYAPIPSDPSTTLGLSLQWTPLAAADDVWHILDVSPGSPAETAGLLPYSDYVIGSPERAALATNGEAALSDLVEAFLDRPLRLFVYNHEYDVARLVTLTPARGWSGDGALGCLLGYGALHRLPAPLAEPAQGPGETLFEAGENFVQPIEGLTAGEEAAAAAQPSEFLVPANLQISAAATAASGPPPAGKARKQRAHHSAAPPAGLDDYFAEGEQKSRELEGTSAAKASSSLPPPPKAGPPKSPPAVEA